MSPRRGLQLLGTVELITLATMLANIVTVHLPDVTHVLGPVHGLAYTATVIAAVLVMGGRHRIWLLALIPGVGGLLASRAAPPAHSERQAASDERVRRRSPE